jgi:hypothetical protein
MCESSTTYHPRLASETGRPVGAGTLGWVEGDQGEAQSPRGHPLVEVPADEMAATGFPLVLRLEDVLSTP